MSDQSKRSTRRITAFLLCVFALSLLAIATLVLCGNWADAATLCPVAMVSGLAGAIGGELSLSC